MGYLEDTGHRPPGRVSAWGGWLMLAGLGTAAYWGIATQTEPEAESGASERPFAQLARDDHGAQVWSLAFSSKGTHLASATITGDVWLKDLVTDQSLRVQRGPINSARSVAFSADGRALAVAGGEPAVALWEVGTGAEMDPLEVGGEAARRVAFSPDGATLAVGQWGGKGRRGAVTLWDWGSRRRRAVLDGHRGGINALAFSPDGARLATGDSTGLVKLWDVAAGRERTSVRAHQLGKGVMDLAYSPDGTMLATAGYLDRAVRLWDAANGEPRGTLPGTAFGVYALAFSPDGRMLALARGDGTAALCGVKPARELGTLWTQGEALQSVAFSKDGQVLATGGMDGALRLWDVAQALGDKSTIRR
jgi:WD40 repeat protein